MEVASSDFLHGILQLDKATWLAGHAATGQQETGQNGPRSNGTLQLDWATWLGLQLLGTGNWTKWTIIWTAILASNPHNPS